EFEDSRKWLRGFAAPQFDETMLDDLRGSVLKDIVRIENRARWIQWIVPGWNLRFAFVTSLALLLLGAWFGLMINRHKPPHDPNSKRAGVRQGGDNQAKLPSGKAPDDSASNDRQIAHDKSDRRGSTLKSIKPGLNESPQTEERMIEPDLIAQNLDT